MKNIRRLLVVAAVLACSTAKPVAVRASCSGPPTVSLLWSYPADGARDVPTNAVFWAVATSFDQAKVTLDGAALPQPASSSAELSLGALLPNHDYTLRVVYGRSYTDYAATDAGVPPSFEIKFRTGEGPATRLPAAPIESVQRSASVSSSTCPDIVNAGECFDTGPDVLLTFDVSSPDAIGWLVHGKPWPARCGKPAAYVHDSFSPGHCPEVAPIGPGGLLGPTQTSCPVSATNSTDAGAGVLGASPDAAATVAVAPVAAADAAAPSTVGEPKTTDDGSCSASAGSSQGGAGSALLLALASLALGRRKRV